MENHDSKPVESDRYRVDADTEIFICGSRVDLENKSESGIAKFVYDYHGISLEDLYERVDRNANMIGLNGHREALSVDKILWVIVNGHRIESICFGTSAPKERTPYEHMLMVQ